MNIGVPEEFESVKVIKGEEMSDCFGDKTVKASKRIPTDRDAIAARGARYLDNKAYTYANKMKKTLFKANHHKKYERRAGRRDDRPELNPKSFRRQELKPKGVCRCGEHDEAPVCGPKVPAMPKFSSLLGVAGLLTLRVKDGEHDESKYSSRVPARSLKTSAWNAQTFCAGIAGLSPPPRCGDNRFPIRTVGIPERAVSEAYCTVDISLESSGARSGVTTELSLERGR
ncbi:hypothetical protein IW261DRAFT_1416114 [Armillaria novae-zelandiae]|uniref:Uncharacterized protein n=1 Tax=Armillaria novae-zelandiae TaxID=153914 RepID=A0AA39PL59_9AGAR|nr:hypothetical protein IW261DRAFT_1416114 [Armillaria novae-zelandiae]